MSTCRICMMMTNTSSEGPAGPTQRDVDENSFVYFAYYIIDFRHDYTATVGIVVGWAIRSCRKTIYVYMYSIFPPTS